MRIIYLHGFASSPESRKAQIFRERLTAAGCDVAVPALDGGDFEHLTISGQYRIVEETAAGEPVVLIGSSMGGYLSALYASRHPEVRKLVLMAPAFDFHARWPLLLGADGFRNWQETGWLSVFHYKEKAMRRVHWGLAADAAQWDPVPDFTQPALIFHGLKDETVPHSGSEAFVARHSNAQLRLYDAGHELTEVVDEMWAETASFLELNR